MISKLIWKNGNRAMYIVKKKKKEKEKKQRKKKKKINRVMYSNAKRSN